MGGWDRPNAAHPPRWAGWHDAKPGEGWNNLRLRSLRFPGDETQMVQDSRRDILNEITVRAKPYTQVFCPG